MRLLSARTRSLSLSLSLARALSLSLLAGYANQERPVWCLYTEPPHRELVKLRLHHASAARPRYLYRCACARVCCDGPPPQYPIPLTYQPPANGLATLPLVNIRLSQPTRAHRRMSANRPSFFCLALSSMGEKESVRLRMRERGGRELEGGREKMREREREGVRQ